MYGLELICLWAAPGRGGCALAGGALAAGGLTGARGRPATPPLPRPTDLCAVLGEIVSFGKEAQSENELSSPLPLIWGTAFSTPCAHVRCLFRTARDFTARDYLVNSHEQTRVVAVLTLDLQELTRVAPVHHLTPYPRRDHLLPESTATATATGSRLARLVRRCIQPASHHTPWSMGVARRSSILQCRLG